MRLTRVDIENFRSIDNLRISFDYGCQALIGINESGKSNVLRAMQLLDPQAAVSPSDLRIERHDDSSVDSGQVRFVFTFDDDEVAEMYASLSTHFEPSSLNLPLAFTNDKRLLTLKELCYENRLGLYTVSLPAGGRVYTIFSWGAEFVPGWFHNSTTSSLAIARPGDEAVYTVPAGGYFYFKDGAPDSQTGLVPASASKFSSIRVALAKVLMSPRMPKCVFWKYSDEYLLPSSVNLAQFLADPGTCVPLMSMFELAGFPKSSLSAKVTKARAESQNRYVQILERTSAAATKHIRRVWKDHDKVAIRLTPNGETLIPTVIDHEIQVDMANRSDGFKRFVSFLLQIAAKVELDEMRGALILIDEPEIALHPSGARDLMKELIAIGESNTVVYSTHSIFMIDKDEIGRHLIVEKKDELTKIVRADKARVQDEEVLYAAMGYSIFETVRHCNLIFEGWRDKVIFRTVAAAMSKKDPVLKARLDQIGLTHAEGVKDVKHVSQFLELAQRPCLIISDADAVALQHRKSYTMPGSWGTWKTLREMGTNAVTGEDLLTRASLVKRANKAGSAIPGLAPLTEAFFLHGEPVAVGLKRWVETANLPAAQVAEELHAIKTHLYENLKRSEIEDEAEKLVAYVAAYDFLEPSDLDTVKG